MALQHGVLVIGEAANNHLSLITTELLSAARELSQTSQTPVAVALFGDQLDQITQEAIQAGADKVFTVEDALLGEIQADMLVQAYEAVCQA
ncbi:MAG: hypothetical protein O7G88_21760, partial [bacterium]|nr:hypothetical protein [bacterium]